MCTQKTYWQVIISIQTKKEIISTDYCIISHAKTEISVFFFFPRKKEKEFKINLQTNQSLIDVQISSENNIIKSNSFRFRNISVVDDHLLRPHRSHSHVHYLEVHLLQLLLDLFLNAFQFPEMTPQICIPN